MFKTCRNIPHIHLHEKKPNKEKWHGAEIQVVIEGNWTTYRVRGLDRHFDLPYFCRILLCMYTCLTDLIVFFSSRRSCTTCAKWLLLLRMRSFFLDLFPKHPSMISISLSSCCSVSLIYLSTCSIIKLFNLFY